MSDQDHIKQAGKIIDAFGGIRPMATRLDISFTTVQGWKKRGVIPANRKNQIMQAAQQHKIDLSSVISYISAASSAAPKKSVTRPPQPPQPKAAEQKVESPAQANPQSKELAKEYAKEQPKEQPAETVKPASHTEAKPSMAATPKATPQQTTQAQLKEMSRQATKRSLMLSGSMVILALLGGYFLFGSNDVTYVEEKISGVQQSVNGLEQRTSRLEGLIPQDIGRQIDGLKQEAAQMQDNMSHLAGEVQNVMQEWSALEGVPIMQRITMLEQQISTVSGGVSVNALRQQLNRLSEDVRGQAAINRAMQDLTTIVEGLEGRMDGFDTALEQAKADNDELASALNNVSGRDLGAAAMLIALGQFRSSVNRNVPFEQDLNILRRIVGGDDEELNEAITRLAPYAEQGVLSPEGLSEELKTLSGEIIMARMAGEDVSVKDRALQRLGEVISVTKDGEPVAGLATAEQEAIANAQAMLDEGDVQGAMQALSALEGESAEAAAPWMQMAQGNIAAQGVEEMILQHILGQMGGMDMQGLFQGGLQQGVTGQQGLPQGAMPLDFNSLRDAVEGVTGGRVQSDPNSGIHILKQ
jgi:hypothetical protein